MSKNIKEIKERDSEDSYSFVKQLFFGRFSSSQVFPYPYPHLEEKERIDLFCHKLRQFCESHIDPIAIDRDSKIPDEVIEGLGKLGMLGLCVPQKYGGLGMSLTAFCKALEVVSQRCGSTVSFLIAHQSGYQAIVLFGTHEQKLKWLPAIAKGEIIVAFALTEPNAGSDIDNIETKAVYFHEKNVFYLTGKKQWITNGSFAKVLIVVAKTEAMTSNGKEQQITAFIVNPDMPGFRVTEPTLDKVGVKGIQTSSLEFDHMEVPAENMLGKLNEGLLVVLTILSYGRVTIGASCAGPAKQLVDHAFKYARERHQFHQSLASFSLVKNKLAILSAMAYAIEAMTYLTAGKVDAGKKNFMLEAAVDKVFSTEALWWMIYETMQIFGGKAMFTDKPYELMMRDCRPSMIVEGSNDVLNMFIAITGIEEVSLHFNSYLSSLKNPIESKDQIVKGFKHIRDFFWPSTVEIYSPLLKKESQLLMREVRRFGRKVFKLLWIDGDRVVNRQIDLERLAKAAVGIYASVAVISKLDSDLEHAHGKHEFLGSDIETGKFFCNLALKNVRLHLEDLCDPHDKDVEHLVDLLIKDL